MKNLKMNCRILVSTLLITGMMMCTDVVFGQCALCNSSQNIEIGLGSATGFLSNAFGNATSSGDYGFSIGSKVFASGKKSFVVGYKAEAYSGDTLNYIFGCGTEDDNLLNDVSNSIMFGTNSNLPTVLVSGASGFNTWGNVGIGNITDPESLLHVRDQVRVGLTGSAAGSLIFNNSAGDTISFNTPASMSDQNYTLPTALGVNGDVLTYTTGGQLTWTNGGTATDDWRLDGNNNATSSSKLGTLNAQ
ncbi:MAG: hypothetical protein K9G41_08085, partial [Flavobacteriales bacterium]|nr:hypothetical protein [Flavobacteriales bacterium]